MILKTWTGRELRVTTEVDWSRGRAFYVVDGIGTFTFERDRYGSTDQRANSLFLYYGRYDDDALYKHDLPEAPVVFGVKLGGAYGFDPAKFAGPEHHNDRYAWHALRAGRAGGSVPAATRKRVHEIGSALLMHYMGRDDYAAIEQARARFLAPTRLREHTEHINELRGKIAALQAELAGELAGADVQAALTRPDPAALVDAT